MAFRIPPGGFAGFAQMTPASRLALSPATPRSTGRKRSRRKVSKPGTALRALGRKQKRSKARAKKGGRKLKFGSPAWRKKYMK